MVVYHQSFCSVCINRQIQLLPKRSSMENRVYTRIATRGISADLSDGVGCYQGLVTNISRYGVCIQDIPVKLDTDVKRLTAIVSGQGQNFKMLIRPQWTTADRLNRRIGGEILNSPYGWLDFVINKEPRHKNDEWGEIFLGDDN